MGVAVPSTFTASCSPGSVDEFVADMLMHRATIRVGRIATGQVWAKEAQGEAAGRSMAVPFNWRTKSSVEDVLTTTCKLGATMMQVLASALPLRKHARWRRDGVPQLQVLTSQPTGFG